MAPESYTFLFEHPFRATIKVGLLHAQGIHGAAVGRIASILSRETDLFPIRACAHHSLV